MKKVFVFIGCVALLSGCTQFENLAFDTYETQEVIKGEVEVPVTVTNLVEVVDPYSGRVTLDQVVSTNYVNEPYEITVPVVHVKPSGAANMASNTVRAFGPWGTLAGAVLTGILGFYARNKNRIAKEKALEAAGLLQEKDKVTKIAKVLVDNIDEALGVIEGLDMASDGTHLKKYLGTISRAQQDYGVRDAVRAIKNSSGLK